VHSFLLRPAVLLAFFISFAAVNFEGANWGLQWSWIFSFLFSASYLPFAIPRLFRKSTYADRRLRLVVRLFAIIFGFTLFAWLCLTVGIINLPEQSRSALGRSMGHTGYLSFYAVVFACLYIFLQRHQANYWKYFRWFFCYPFIFIAAWGVYQNIATYDIIGYSEMFNNSLSTGFTYERFRAVHRVSSVFPEPSEYSYYLALMTPIVWACFRGKLPAEAYRYRWPMLLLLLTQIVMIRSLSYFVALPVVAYVIVVHVEGRSGRRAILPLMYGSLVLLLIAGVGLASRLGEVAAGDDGSTLERYLGLLETFEVFIRSPFFGFGYGIVRGLDAVTFLLASLGIIGSSMFVLTLFQFIKSVKVQASPILSGALVGMIASCITSNNILSHIFVWMLFAFLAACPKVQTSAVFARQPRKVQTVENNYVPIAATP
jgi:hypothetical protein